MERLKVECYSGYKADEHPTRFQLGDYSYEVKEVLDQWHGPEATYFRVLAGDGNVYILRHGRLTDSWSLESFRRGERTG